MDKKDSLKEDPGEAKVTLGEAKRPLDFASVVEERTVSFNLGDADEVPERERPDLKETNVDSGESWPSRVRGRSPIAPLGPTSLLSLLQAPCSYPAVTRSSSTQWSATK